MSEVFLLGAGFSKAVSGYMPVLKELSEILQDRVALPPQVGGLTSRATALK